MIIQPQVSSSFPSTSWISIITHQHGCRGRIFSFQSRKLWILSFSIWCCSSADDIECFNKNCLSIHLIFFRKHDLDSFWKTDGLVSSVMVCGLNRLLRFQETEYTMRIIVQPCTLEWQSVVMQVDFSSWVYQIMAGQESWDNVHYDDFLLWQISILCEPCHAASGAHDQVLMSVATKKGCWSIYVSFSGNVTSIVFSRQMDRSALW